MTEVTRIYTVELTCVIRVPDGVELLSHEKDKVFVETMLNHGRGFDDVVVTKIQDFEMEVADD